MRDSPAGRLPVVPDLKPAVPIRPAVMAVNGTLPEHTRKDVLVLAAAVPVPNLDCAVRVVPIALIDEPLSLFRTDERTLDYPSRVLDVPGLDGRIDVQIGAVLDLDLQVRPVRIVLVVQRDIGTRMLEEIPAPAREDGFLELVVPQNLVDDDLFQFGALVLLLRREDTGRYGLKDQGRIKLRGKRIHVRMDRLRVLQGFLDEYAMIVRVELLSFLHVREDALELPLRLVDLPCHLVGRVECRIETIRDERFQFEPIRFRHAGQIIPV